MSIRRIVALFAAALVLAGLGYTAYWFHAAAGMRKGLERWAEARRADGWQVAWDDLERGGFPLHLRLSLGAPRLTTPSGLRWRGERLVGLADPFNPTRLRLQAGGRHDLGWPGAEAVLNAATLDAEINLDHGGRLEDATVMGAGLTLTGAAHEPLTAAGLAAMWDPLPVAQADHTTATVRFTATAHDLTLPAWAGLPLDRSIGLVEITGRVMGAIPDAAPAEALARWSADGGAVELDHVSLEWPPMALEAQGTLALDPAGQPLASLSTRMRGFGALMDRLADSGTLPADTAAAAKMVLMLMARPDSRGRPSVPVPVSLQDGSLYLGPARVAQVPALVWR